MPINKNYVAYHNAWDKSTMHAINQLKASIEHQKKEMQLAKDRLTLDKKQLLVSLEGWRIAKADHNKYLKANK